MLNRDKTTINVITTCDNAYVQHTAVFLKSLFAQNPDTNCRIFVLVPDNFIHRRSLERNLGSHLEFLNINRSETASLKSIAAYYYRLFLDQLMPMNIDRAIYLDSDILIVGSLEELWAIDLEKHVIAAVSDVTTDRDQSVRQKIGLAPTSHYFNSGVLVINFCRWRNAQLGKRALNFAVEHPDLITYPDQCALNHVLKGQFKELTKDWNFQTGHLWAEDGKCAADALRDLEAAKIIHFTGRQKPWYYLTNHPMKWLYWKYLRETEWRDYCPPDRNARNILRKNLENKAPALVNAARRARTLWRPTMG
jgi:lipopolysaccharide biosynthesis glycosyltransferase